jgi:hypothetical protein
MHFNPFAEPDAKARETSHEKRPMPDLNIRNVDPELIRDVKIIAAKQDANMREMVIHILRAYVNRFTARLDKKSAK